MVVDASVAVKWFIEEDRSGEAKALMTAGVKLAAPRFVILEVAHVLWKVHRRQAISTEKREVAAGVMNAIFGDGADTDRLAGRATVMMQTLSHPVYDCLYIALAEREGVPLVTADERQYAAARRARVEARLL